MIFTTYGALSFDLVIRKHAVVSSILPREIMHKMNNNVFWSHDSSDYGHFILARPFKNKRIRAGGRFDQNGSLTSLVERKA